MGAQGKILVDERNAAAMLDLPVQDFRQLVACGALPAPLRLAGRFERWKVAHLEAIVSGDAAKPADGDFEV